MIGKVVEQSKGVSHVGPKTCFSARPLKDELGNGNAIRAEVHYTNREDWEIA